MLTGENGIINRTTQAKRTTEDAEVAEKIRLAFLNAQIGKYAGKSEDFAAVMQAELVKTLGTGATVTSNGTGFLVTYGDMKFDVSNTGAVERKSGVIITQKVEKIKNGSTAPVTATLDGITGTISWKSSDSTKVLVTGSGTSATIEGKASSGSATITAYIAGTEHEDSFTVNIAQTATGITANPPTAQIAKNGTVQMGVDIAPTGVVEDLAYTYSSSNTSVATVNESGLVTGVASGTATITITAVENTNLTTQCTITVTKVAVESVQIKDANGIIQTVKKADAANWYGKKVDYTAGGATYRIFFIDYEGKYGEPGTIYLKADYNSSFGGSLPISVDISLTKIIEMNPSWAEGTTSSNDTTKRKNVTPDSWNDNEKAAAYLCTPVAIATGSTLPWANCFEGDKADYVIGGPSTEMYCESYSQVSHIGTGVTGNYLLEAVYSYESYPGYKYKYTDLSVSNATPVTDTYTPYESLDYSTLYNHMYCGENGEKNGAYWLASPSSSDYNKMGFVLGTYYACLSSGKCSNSNGFCPLVSLKSSFIPQVQAET